MKQIKYLTKDETARLLKQVTKIGDLRDIALWTVAYWRGLRISEVGLIERGYYKERDRRLYVPRLKGSVSAEYKISPEEFKALKKWLQTRGSEMGPLFWSYRNHQRGVGKKRLDQLHRKYAELAGLPVDKWNFHTLRHSIATHLVSDGVDLKAVQDWLGHRDIKSTLVYAQLTNPARDRIAEEVYRNEKTVQR